MYSIMWSVSVYSRSLSLLLQHRLPSNPMWTYCSTSDSLLWVTCCPPCGPCTLCSVWDTGLMPPSPDTPTSSHLRSHSQLPPHEPSSSPFHPAQVLTNCARTPSVAQSPPAAWVPKTDFEPSSISDALFTPLGF